MSHVFLSSGGTEHVSYDKQLGVVINAMVGYVFVVVCLSVCLSVSNFVQKLPNGFA